MPEDQTTIITRDDVNEELSKKPSPDHSHIFRLSVRALICLIVVCTICYMSVAGKKIDEPLYSLGNMVIGYYFGQTVQQLGKAIKERNA
jgi:hypothetical protein